MTPRELTATRRRAATTSRVRLVVRWSPALDRAIRRAARAERVSINRWVIDAAQRRLETQPIRRQP
jgi:predicted HicB family RNase H-like nuclease